MAETFKANYRPSKTAFSRGSVAFANNCLAFLRAKSNSSKIKGSKPFLTLDLTKTLLAFGDFVYYPSFKLIRT